MMIAEQRALDVDLTTATEPQYQFWCDASKYRAFIGGIGSGKTFAGVIEILKQPAGTRGAVIAPTYNMLKKAPIRTFLEITEASGLLKSFNKSELVAELYNGTKIDFMTADNPERLRGLNLGWFWMDEAAMMSDDTWLIMLGRLRLSPGKAWITTTPKGFNWLYKTFNNGLDDYKIIKSKTNQNLFLPKSYLDSLEGQYSTSFARQELEGEFIDDSSNLIKADWWQYYRVLPKVKRLVWSWDTAFEKGKENDYSVGTLWADCQDGYYLVDLVRDKFEFPELKRTVINSFQKYKSSVIIIEKKASGHSLIQELRRSTSLPIKEIKVDKDKLSRVHAINAYIESGRVFLPEGQPWLKDFVEECSLFPSPKIHDDQVDSMTQALNYMIRIGSYQIGFI
tara:strand:- start:15621 stop:16805 length:1185 start_codon:yes stop_codon:yes gene_type:complete